MSHRIFLVEDDASFRALLGEYLDSLGYSVREFGSGEELLRALEGLADPPDLVISDLNLGRVTGMQLLEELRRRNSQPPVILMTAFGSRETVQKVRSAGAAGYLDKSFEFDQIHELIEQVLQAA
jgi:DNA-binding response OmpR family regulator